MRRYCYYCDKEVEYRIVEKEVELEIKGVEVKYLARIAYCNECGNEIDVPELDDENIKRANLEYRKKAGIITVEEIQALLEKYDIGKKPLAALLGWGETTIERYFEGVTPLKIYSDELKRLQNPRYMLKVYEANKEALSEVARKKLKSALDRLLNYKPEKTAKVEDVANFFLSKVDNEAGSAITPLKLQKLLYYAQGWHLAFFDAPLFTSDLEAWVHGPVCPEIYYKYRDYGYRSIEKVEENVDALFDISQVELLNVINEVYGIFDAKVLERMTHKDEPWREARKGYQTGELCNEIISKESIKNYFKTLKEIFDINEIEDIKKSLRRYQDIFFL
ncbi:MAG: type II TA system antitoxin MqsA family protein [Moorellaceae bacterium]